jgi:hypothetical protein
MSDLDRSWLGFAYVRPCPVAGCGRPTSYLCNCEHVTVDVCEVHAHAVDARNWSIVPC